MNDSYHLIKENPLLPAEDYEGLRKKGLQSVEDLGSDHWTEYNSSDPGITILEAVSYAITDLAYRTGFEVRDLLTPQNLTEDTWKNIFYTARKIYHNSPLTINDYRKMIIDVKGVRNAWIEPSKDYEVPIWIDYNFIETRKSTHCGCDEKESEICHGRLDVEPVSPQEVIERKQKHMARIDDELLELNSKVDKLNASIEKVKLEIEAQQDSEIEKQILQRQLLKLEKEKEKWIGKSKKLDQEKKAIMDLPITPIDSKIVEIEGLYNVLLEFEEDIVQEQLQEEVSHRVIERLMSHRNLCEDFLSVSEIDYLDFGIGASFVLEEYADPDEVLAEIFFIIYKYFTPSVPFHTIPEMLSKGLQVDEVFEGPALQHGFIDTFELENTDLFRDIRLSDLISLISDIPGLKAITYLHLPFTGFDDSTTGVFYFNEWVKLLKEDRKVARIQPGMSKVLFCKSHDFISYNTNRPKDRKPERMLKKFNDKKKQERNYKLVGHDRDFEVPTGDYMELQDYFPVTYSLPLCYGVNPREGLLIMEDDPYKVMAQTEEEKIRIIKARQLSGYMLFFEQLLANYLVQLDHLRDLFSFDDEKKTYFTRALTEIENLGSLLINHGNHNPKKEMDAILQDFSNVLQYITEPPALFLKRRNRFLNHLLARFSENLDEYESISNWLSNGNATERMIEDKMRMMKDGAYYKISTNRGKAYNYTTQKVWDTPNVSGAETRIGRLLGFRNVNRRTLAPEYMMSERVMITDEKTRAIVQKKNLKGNYLNVIRLVDHVDNQKVLLTSVEVADGCCTEDLMGEILAHADNRIYFTFHEELKQRSRKSAGVLGVFWFELWDNTDPDYATLLAYSEKFDSSKERENAFRDLQNTMNRINDNEGLHLIEHILLRPRINEESDEAGQPVNILFPDVCLDVCDLGKGLGEGEVPYYRKKLRRIPRDKCYDKMPWVLEYFRWNETNKKYDQSILYQDAFKGGKDPVLLKFRRYEKVAKRIKDLQVYGAERINYQLDSNVEVSSDNIKHSFIIMGDEGEKLAQSPYVFNKRTPLQIKNGISVKDDIEIEIERLMRYFEFQLDLYCSENPCDNNEDPFSFRTTLVLPCWPKRFRDLTFRGLVEKTIQSETPAHIDTRVVWLGIEQMKKFEAVYLNWLEEMARTEIPAYEFVNPFIETLNTLVPCGCCSDDCNHK